VLRPLDVDLVRDSRALYLLIASVQLGAVAVRE
jgi:hypothetical protein